MDDLSLVRDPTALSVVAGSRAYGLATENGDLDRRGVHLMPIEDVVGLRVGEVLADLTELDHGPEYVPEMVAAEHGTLPAEAPDPGRLAAGVAAMTARLETERDRSSLPERPAAGPAPHEFVVRARLADLPHVNSRSQG